MEWQFGIDTAAHIGALEVNGKTVAVLGSGFKNIFPKENIKLFKEIVDKGGLIISEYSPETEPDSKQFLERNRIVSGLSIGVLVIEAAYRSGTSVTCKIAKEQGKKVFCIPHNLEDKHGIGTNRLIKNGAHLVTDARDILTYFDFIDYEELYEELAEELAEEEIQTSIDVDKKYVDIYNILVGPPLNINEICNKLCKSANEVNNALFMLELDGLIIKTKHGYQARIV